MQKIAHLRKTLQSLKPFQIRNYFIYIVRLRLGAYKKQRPNLPVMKLADFDRWMFLYPIKFCLFYWLIQTASKKLHKRSLLDVFPFYEKREWSSQSWTWKPLTSLDENSSWTKWRHQTDLEPARFSGCILLFAHGWFQNPVYQDYFGYKFSISMIRILHIWRELVFCAGIGYAHHRCPSAPVFSEIVSFGL